MYQLNFEGFQIYDPRLEELTIRDVSVHLAVDESGSLSFTIDHEHPFADQLTKLKGRLELLADGLPIFRGRILSDVQNFDLSRTIEAEGQLACLNDSVVPPYDFPTDYEDDDDSEYEASENVVSFWLGKLIDSHNSQVTEEQQIKLGNVTVADPNNYISRSNTSYSTTWETITDKLSGSSLGGHLLVRYEADGTYLDYLSDYELSNVQSIEFAENLLDMTDEVDGTEIYTAIYPVGADGLTIADLDDGDLTEDLVKQGNVIYSKAGIEKYGRIVSVQEWDDVTENINLRSKAMELLAQSGVFPVRTISVTAVDLHFTDAEIAALRVGRYTQITSTPHGLDARYALTELDPDILDPGNTRITLGASIQTFTGSANNNNSNIANIINDQQTQINNQQSNIEQIAQTTSEQITSVVQNSQEIIFKALEDYALTIDLESLRETVSSQLTVLSNEIELRFTQAVEEIQSVSGDLQSKYSDLTKYFKFTVDGLVIGQEGNELTLKVDNDRISFLDGGLEVAYISNKQLYITDAHFLNSLRIGKFAWIPRRSGNLSLVKVE